MPRFISHLLTAEFVLMYFERRSPTKAHNFISEVNKILFIRFNCFFTVTPAAGLSFNCKSETNGLGVCHTACACCTAGRTNT